VQRPNKGEDPEGVFRGILKGDLEEGEDSCLGQKRIKGKGSSRNISATKYPTAVRGNKFRNKKSLKKRV